MEAPRLDWKMEREGKTFRVHCGCQSLTVWWARGVWLFWWTAVTRNGPFALRGNLCDAEEALSQAEMIFANWLLPMYRAFEDGGTQDYRALPRAELANPHACDEDCVGDEDEAYPDAPNDPEVPWWAQKHVPQYQRNAKLRDQLKKQYSFSGNLPETEARQ